MTGLSEQRFAGHVPGSPASGRQPVRIDFMQALRGIAALLVVIYHVIKEENRLGLTRSVNVLRFAETLQFGVDLFFVISGFIMVYVTRNKAATPHEARLFLEKRLLRVVPLYWIFTLLAAAMIVMAPAALHTTHIDPAYLIASLLFVPWPSANNDGFLPVLGLGWTLLYEMFFYLLYAALLALGVRRRVTALYLIFAALVVVGQFVGHDQPQLWYFTRSTLFMFAFGATLATIFVRRCMLVPEAAALAIFAIGIASWQAVGWTGIAFLPEYRGFLLGVPAALIMFAIMRSQRLGVLLDRCRVGVALQIVGDASYSLYLAHMFLVRLVTIAMQHAHLRLGFAGYFAVTLAFCVAGAIVIHRLIEKPLLAFATRMLPRNQSVAAAVH